MSTLPAQPYVVNDFSGGLTENFIQGGPKRFMTADNLLITVDRKLEERFGSDLIDSVNYQLPSGNQRIGSLISFESENYLFAQSGSNLYVLNPNWSPLLGPTGNPPLPNTFANNVVSWGEWQHHLLLTSDSLATKPVKVYLDSTNTFQTRTAGLPTLVPTPNISASQNLLLAINIANDIRTQFLAHMQDSGAVNVGLHVSVDPGQTTLTITPAATDLPSLLVLCAALITVYESHITDAINTGTFQGLHYNSGFATVSGLNQHLGTTVAPVDLATATTVLDDMKTKYTWHSLSPVMHDSVNNYVFFAKHQLTAPHIGTVTTGPVLTQNISNSLALVNALRTKYNSHLTSSEHMLADTTNTVLFPAATDFDSMCLLISHIRFEYMLHWADANKVHNLTTATTVSTSTSITAIVLNSTGSAYTPTSGNTIYDSSGITFPTQPVFVSSPGSGTGTASVAASHSGSTTLDFTSARYHVGQTTNVSGETLGGAPTFVNSLSLTPGVFVAAGDLSSWVALLSASVTVFNAHDLNAVTHKTAGGFQVTTYVPAIAQYAYAFHYFYQYTLYNGVIFQIVGTPSFVGPIQTEQILPAQAAQNILGAAPSIIPATTLSISNIAPLVNSAGDNYDTSNILVKIYRTITTGSTYFFDGSVANGVTTFTDITPDSSTVVPNVTILSSLLQTNITLYTTGGIVNFDAPPLAKYVHVINNTAYYGAIIDTGQTFLNRIRQSIQNNIDAAPGSFFDDLDDQITGLSDTRSNLIAVCKNSVYRVYGAFSPTGQGALLHERISDTVGGVGQASIVRTEVGVFFAGTDGFYYTDGYQLIKLSSELNLTYAALVSNAQQRKNIYGAYDRYNRRIWWSTQPNASDYDVSKSYIYHLNFGVNANGVFTTASNGDNYRPSSMLFYRGLQYRGDARGFLFVHSSAKQTDPLVVLGATPTLWNTAVIPYNYSSCAIDFGTTFMRKWTTRISLQGENLGNVAGNISSISDQGRVPPANLKPLWFNQNIQWGKPNIIWGASNASQPIVWGATSTLDMWRRFPATQLRCDFKQIVLTPAKIGVYRYEDWPIGAFASVTAGGAGSGTATILSPSPYTNIVWPVDIVGYVLSVATDGYVLEYPITAVSGNQLTYSDPSNTLHSGAVAWVIRGVMKQQRLSLQSYNIHFSLIGKNQQAYQGASNAGENV